VEKGENIRSEKKGLGKGNCKRRKEGSWRVGGNAKNSWGRLKRDERILGKEEWREKLGRSPKTKDVFTTLPAKRVAAQKKERGGVPTTTKRGKFWQKKNEIVLLGGRDMLEWRSDGKRKIRLPEFRTRKMKLLGQKKKRLEHTTVTKEIREGLRKRQRREKNTHYMRGRIGSLSQVERNHRTGCGSQGRDSAQKEKLEGGKRGLCRRRGDLPQEREKREGNDRIIVKHHKKKKTEGTAGGGRTKATGGEPPRRGTSTCCKRG